MPRLPKELRPSRDRALKALSLERPAGSRTRSHCLADSPRLQPSDALGGLLGLEPRSSGFRPGLYLSYRPRCGGPARTRTGNPLLAKQTLYVGATSPLRSRSWDGARGFQHRALPRYSAVPAVMSRRTGLRVCPRCGRNGTSPRERNRVERTVGFEPTTHCLEGSSSTAELCPLRGAHGWSRTSDPPLRRRALCPAELRARSCDVKERFDLAGVTGLEPATSDVTGRCSTG